MRRGLETGNSCGSASMPAATLPCAVDPANERGHQQHRDQGDREAFKQRQTHRPSPCGIAGYLKE
jgi:hypothetical protein